MSSAKRPSLAALVAQGSEPEPRQEQPPEPVAPSASRQVEAPRGYQPPPSRQGKKPKTIYLEPEAMRLLKRIAADEDTNVEALIREGINAVLQRRNLPQIA